MQRRILEILHGDDASEIEEQWSKIRRGWVFGSDEFRLKMESTLNGKQRASFSGEMVEKHDERQATELLAFGLKVCNLNTNDLPQLKKGDDRKAAIAWLIRRNTCVKNRWISESLGMGHESSVSRNIKRIEAANEGELLLLKQAMSKFKD